MGKVACYCDTGDVMAQCVAKGRDEQNSCHFSEQSDHAPRCMYLNENLNNNCWSQEAQDYSKIHGVVRAEDLPVVEDVLAIDDLSNLFENDNHGCRDCILFPCRDVNSIAKDKARKGQQLSEEDLHNLGSLCKDFVDEATFSEDVGKLGGGIVL